MTVALRPTDDASPASRSSVARLLTTAAWTIAVLVLTLISLSAVFRTNDLLGALLAEFPRPYGRAGLAVIAVYAAGSLAVIVFARLCAARQWLVGPRLPLLIVALAIIVRVVLAMVADAPLNAENRIVHEQALKVLDGACCFSHRPLGYPIALAGAYALLGVGPTAIETLNIAFAAVTVALVWQIGNVTWGRSVAAVAATAFAVVPSQVLMVIVPLTEPMYTLLVTGAVRVAIVLERRPALAAGAVSAGLLAVAQYVRATAAPLVVLVAVLPWLVGWTLRRTLLRAALIGCLFMALLLPVIAYNVRAYGDLSVATSAYGGWSLYVGANREAGGQWNAADAARLAGFPGDSWWERSEYAGTLVIGRVMEDPLGSLAVLPRKFATVWGDETYAATYALRGRAVTRDVHVGWLASQLFWLPLVVLATLGMVVARRDHHPAALLIGMSVSLVAVMHLALEVHSRYHAYLVPLVCLLAATGADAVARSWRGRRPLSAAP